MSAQTGSPSLLDTAVERFYALVVADPQLAPWFTGVDVDRLRRHQAEFLGAALDGGSTRFDLRRTHAGLGIDDAAYDRLVAHLAAALAEVGVDEGHVRELAALVDGLRDQVVEA
ncbi:hemoglobin [Klenkia marina]|uniref:Hemoglobin n=1 Tax=Klenkia marina TaxID=1960309 RepID=A0A1G4X9T6_9ACTN|nr:group 1 truncated hemoglobin [Klenkia marina]SCX38000.1 hemoglobin [Klenkia marina]